MMTPVCCANLLFSANRKSEDDPSAVCSGTVVWPMRAWKVVTGSRR